ncbi:MAG: hypothetical protein ACJ73E_07580 [Mycobacteriales bacterium]
MSASRSRSSPLLAATVQNARRSPLYAADPDWQAVAAGAGAFEDLPLMTKEIYRSRSTDLLQPPDVAIQHTKGTTGEVTFRYRRAGDAEFLAGVLAAVWESGYEPSVRRPLVLRELDGSHGGPVAEAAGTGVLTASDDPAGFERAVHLLTRRFRVAGLGDRVAVVSGRLRFLIILTTTLRERGIPAASLGVGAVLTYGSFVSRRWRAFLEDFWGVGLLDSYSLSEIFGSATRCPDCGDYRFDEPSVHAEFVSPATGGPVDEGWAVPVLTELYPFVTHEPLVRYWTGDLVRLDPRGCCGPGSFAVKGRLESAVRDLDRTPARVLVPWTELVEVLEDVEGLAWEVDPFDWSTRDQRVSAALRAAPLGVPQIATRVREAAPGVRRIELDAVVPDCRAGGGEQVAEHLRQRLLVGCALLAEAVQEGAYQLHVRVVDRLRPRPGREARTLIDRMGS